MEKQPLKYKQLNKALHNKVAIMPTQQLMQAFERVKSGNFSSKDEAVIDREVYLSHWDIATDDSPTHSTNLGEVSYVSDLDFVQTTQNIDIDRRNALLYKRLLKRVFQLQAKLDRSNTGEITQKWISPIDSTPTEMVINQEFVFGMLDMAHRTRLKLYDAGHQKMVERIHEQQGVSINENGDLQKTIIIADNT